MISRNGGEAHSPTVSTHSSNNRSTSVGQRKRKRRLEIRGEWMLFSSELPEKIYAPLLDGHDHVEYYKASTNTFGRKRRLEKMGRVSF